MEVQSIKENWKCMYGPDSWNDGFNELENTIVGSYLRNDKKKLTDFGVTKEMLKEWKKKPGFKDCVHQYKMDNGKLTIKTIEFSDLKNIIEIRDEKWPNVEIKLKLESIYRLYGDKGDKKFCRALKDVCALLNDKLASIHYRKQVSRKVKAYGK